MLHEYALEPELLAGWEAFRYLIEKFGPSEGRLIAKYPRDWKARVYAALAGCKPVEKAKIELKLGALPDRFLVPRAAHVWDERRSWLENAEDEHARVPFHAIVAAANPRAHAHVVDGREVDETEPRWRVDRDRLVPRTSADMAAAVAPLLRVSTQFLFVDPYFRADQDDKREPMRAFLAIIGGSRATGATVRPEVHTGDELGYAMHRRDCERALPGILPANVTLRIVRWQERAGGEKLHNRYILTDVGGIEFGTGLDQETGAQHDRLSLLSETVRAALWAQYAGPMPAFDPDGAPFDVRPAAAAAARPPRR